MNNRKNGVIIGKEPRTLLPYPAGCGVAGTKGGLR